MADFSALKTAIQANIRTNANEEITGAILQEILLSMVTTMGDGAINALSEALLAEITNRQNAVSGEATTRAEADSQLSGRINAEAQTRSEADTQLGNSITAITTRLNEGYVYAGIATPSTNPGTPAGKVFYIALQAGTYTNFSSLAVTQGITILKYSGMEWSQEQLVVIDDVPTAGSNNLVKSGGVKTALIQERKNNSFKFICFQNQLEFTGIRSFSLTAPTIFVRNFITTEYNAEIDVYSIIKTPQGNTDGVTITSDDNTHVLNITFSSGSNHLTLLYKPSTNTIECWGNSYNIPDDAVLIVDITGYTTGLGFTGDQGDYYISLVYNKYLNDELDKEIKENVINSILINGKQKVYTGEDRSMTGTDYPVFGYFQIAQGDIFDIYVKDENFVDDTFTIGIGYNGSIELTKAQVRSGYWWHKTANTATNLGRIWITNTTNSSNVLIAYTRVKADELIKEVDDINKVIGLPVNIVDINNYYYQKGLTASGLATGTNSKRVSCDVMALPAGMRTIKAKSLPNGIVFGVRSGETKNSIDLNQYWYTSSNNYDLPMFSSSQPCRLDTIIIPAEHNYYALSFAKSGNTAGAEAELTFGELVTYMENGQVVIEFEATGIKKELENNKRIPSSIDGFDAALASLKHVTITASPLNNYRQYFAFAHITDIHGDYERTKNLVEITKKLGLDTIIGTGDYVRYYSNDNFNYLINEMQDVHFIGCIGNHETFGYNSDALLYNRFISPFVTKEGLVTGGEVPYFYKDISVYKIRLIALSQYKAGTMQAYISKAQIDFFVDTLANTPADYGVIVLIHAPEHTPVKDNNYGKFHQGTIWGGVIQTDILWRIVDAFISKTTVSFTYTNAADSSEVSVSADFTNLNSGVEFICYCNGHIHSDAIGYSLNATNLQLNLNAVCSCAWINKNTDGRDGTDYPYYNEINDLSRQYGTPSENAFNIYVIDRVNKQVRVSRVGSQLTNLFERRDCMVIPYKLV